MSEPVFRNPPWRESGNQFSALTEREWDWWHRQFRLPDAWKHSRGEGVKVAVLDTGYSSHRDLEGQILKVRDFTSSRSGPADRQGHSTHCCGIVAAKEDDAGIMGVAPDAKLLVGKVLGDDGSGGGNSIAAGVEWAASEGADVISMSLGSPQEDRRISASIRSAVKAGITVVCAAGNEGQANSVGWPGRLPEVICVAAVDRNLKLAKFSSRGPEVDIAAGGQDILSTYLNNTFMRLSGTSMATPQVAGVIALLIAARKGIRLTPSNIRKLIVENADDAGEPGHDQAYGWGLIRPERIVGGGQPAPPQPPKKPGVSIGPFSVRWITYEDEPGLFASYRG